MFFFYISDVYNTNINKSLLNINWYPNKSYSMYTFLELYQINNKLVIICACNPLHSLIWKVKYVLTHIQNYKLHVLLQIW